MSVCPECNASIDNKEFDIGEVIECPGCGVELEIIGLDPLDLELFEEEEK
ncbi:lysine biosynthesis protein LysW [bacterium]|nr:lysine biosynthesis protein LysW [bacterium]